MSIHALTNLASGHSFELTVPVGEDVTALAKEYLLGQQLPEDQQAGFYVSVFPVGEEPAPLVAEPPTNLDSSPNGTPYDPES
ncbi:hypothetical protein GIS00_13285 [Nakamurella sp. YIM 132087]|uniref:Uncharacterized protein n=1 Tax=Nakamurella alba TaxID=2665158 RepID=A0A7K1FNW1_9ACTN|nr:hypothetical protein [Nakamurella alba]MTD14913.1 hypothetical protein [Nakamurella alba]